MNFPCTRSIWNPDYYEDYGQRHHGFCPRICCTRPQDAFCFFRVTRPVSMFLVFRRPFLPLPQRSTHPSTLYIYPQVDTFRAKSPHTETLFFQTISGWNRVFRKGGSLFCPLVTKGTEQRLQVSSLATRDPISGADLPTALLSNQVSTQ